MTPSAFMQLSPRLRAGIADQLRWSGLRPVQEASIPSVLAGENAIILAPTAGGKTEAAFFPALDLLHRQPRPGVRLLYLSPLVALLNNQEDRVSRLAGLLGMTAFKWHGGVGASARKAFLADPAEVLLTTPESLEAMFIHGQPVGELFGHLRLVIVDEVHAFAASDRGAQLISLIERLTACSDEDVQRLGLSATVANPGDLGRWLRGSSARPGRVVRPPGATPSRTAEVVSPDHPDALADLIGRVRHRRTLAFTESRADAEEIADHLRRRAGLDFSGSYHSAISRDARQTAEDALAGGGSACVACTSAMELGVDIGDLDGVLQWGTPGSVSSLLQRWGRTGRRAGRAQHTVMYPKTERELLTTAALLSLAQEGWVEAVRPDTRAYHILLQQLLSEVLRRAHTPDSLLRAVQTSPAFSQIPEEERRDVLRHLVAHDLLAHLGGQLALGDRGERLFGRRQLGDLIATFEIPDSFTLVDTRDHAEVGQIELAFVEELREDLAAGLPVVVLLGGQAWQVTAIQDRAGTVLVRPDQSGRPPKWAGGLPRQMERALAWRHRELLSGHPLPDGLDQASAELLRDMAARTAALFGSRLPVTGQGLTLVWHTYAGTRINTTLQAALQPFGAVAADALQVSLRARDETARQAALALLASDWSAWSAEERHALLERVRLPRVSKYQVHLPPAYARRMVLDRFIDWEGTLDVLRGSSEHREAKAEQRGG